MSSLKIMALLNYDLAKQAFKLNSTTFSEHETGTFVRRIVSDPDKIVNSMADLMELTTDLISVTVMLIYIATLNIWASLVMLASMIIGMSFEILRIKKRRKNKFIVRQKDDRINSLTTEIVRSEKDIKSLGLENKLGEYSKQNYEEYRKARLKLMQDDRNFHSLRNITVELGSIIVIILGIRLMDLGLMTLGTFMIIYSNRWSMHDVVKYIGSIANNIVEFLICHKRMFALFDETEFVTEKFGNVHLDNIKGEIEFKNVEFSYKNYEYTYPTKKELKKDKNAKVSVKVKSVKPVFDNLSFKIPNHSTVAFVGDSGSGKSTILNLISRMYVADGGEVLIDDTNINDLDKSTLRSTISLVNQFPYIFDMSIKDNLLLAKSDATDSEILDAIESASLGEFVQTLPDGINSVVGESGIKLSGGQKQRLAIARAFLRKSPIIIFDESTSSLDNFTQEFVKKSIDKLKGTSTIIIVAHRLSTIKNVDKIFYLNKGNIEDIGTFNELFDKNKRFRAMFLAENI